MRWFTELLLKYFWCGLGFNFMHKDNVVQNIKLKYIKNFAFSKQLSGMCESVFIMHDPDGIFLQTVDFFKICSVGTSPGYISGTNVGMYEGII